MANTRTHKRNAGKSAKVKSKQLQSPSRGKIEPGNDPNEQSLQQISRRLNEKGAFGNAHGTVSIRIPGGNQFLFLDTSARDHGKPHKVLALSRETAPDPTLYDLHARIYEMRGDVGSILTGCPEWGMTLAEIPGSMPAVFDEQARQLGKSIEHISTDSHASHPDELFRELQKGSNVVLMSDSVLICGVTPEKLVFNSELLEKCAKAYLLAYLTGQRIRKIPFYVRIIANSRMLKDQKRSAESYARGEVPGGFTAY